MESNHGKQYILHLRKFLQDKMHDPDVSGEIIVRRHEVEEVASGVGMDESEGWRRFRELNGHAWDGLYMVESHSEERGFTAVRLR
jgi:hypothetical protein